MTGLGFCRGVCYGNVCFVGYFTLPTPLSIVQQVYRQAGSIPPDHPLRIEPKCIYDRLSLIWAVKCPSMPTTPDEFPLTQSKKLAQVTGLMWPFEAIPFPNT